MDMKNFVLGLILLVLPGWCVAQGIQFEQISVGDALQKARSENKMVFIDVYAEWCGPCKKMAADVFTNAEVGKYFNETFVNLQLDGEKGEGLELAKRFRVNMYPTYVVLDVSGRKIFQTAGYHEPAQFLDLIRNGVDPNYVAEEEKEFHFKAHLKGAKDGYASLMILTRNGQCLRPTFPIKNGEVDFTLNGRDTMEVNVQLACEALGTPSAMDTYYPNFDVMMVPGEKMEVNIEAAKGKVPVLTWKGGGAICRDYFRLNFEMPGEAEKAYQQISMTNIIENGDIRNYQEEADAAWAAEKERMKKFVDENRESYIAAICLSEKYFAFDENFIQEVYDGFPIYVKNSSYGKQLAKRLGKTMNVRTGAAALDFEKQDMDGNTVALHDFAGKYVLLDFWGSWCGPCRASHPHLKELWEKYKDQVVFIGIAQETSEDMEENRAEWKKAVEEDGMGWTQVLNNEGETDVVKLYGIAAFPTKILISPEGKILCKLVGGSQDIGAKLEEFVK